MKPVIPTTGAEIKADRINRVLDVAERQLRVYVPGASIGYIGNLSSRDDDRAWYVFLPGDVKLGGFTTDARHKLAPIAHAAALGAKAAYLAAKGGAA